MKDIGKRIEEKRKELNLSYEDISKMTKMPTENIRAIERGDIEFFQNDITYLRFYVRAYCKALDLPFEDYREQFDESIDEFTQTISLRAIKEREEIEENIAARTEVKKADTYKEPPIETVKDRGSIRQNASQSTRFHKKGKLDVSLISLLVIVVVVIGVIVFVMFNNGMNPNAGDSDKPIISDTETPTPEKEKDEEKEKEKENESKYTVNELAVNSYEINGLKTGDPLKVDIKFTEACWLVGTLNGTQQMIMSDTYTVEKPVNYEGVVGANDVYSISFGKYKTESVSIFINGEKLEINPDISNEYGVTPTINITVKGN